MVSSNRSWPQSLAGRPRPRVLVVGATPPPYGGPETITQNILSSDHLQAFYDVKFLNMRKSIRIEERGRFGWKNVAYGVWHLVRFAGVLVIGRAQLVLLPYAQNRAGCLRDSVYALLAHGLGRKVILHAHGGNFHQFFHAQSNWLRRVISFVLRRVDLVIVLAERLRSQFEDLVAEEKIDVIYNGIKAAEPFAGMDISRVDTAISVLFFGSISVAKGALDLLLAVPLVVNHVKSKARFLFVGEFVTVERNIVSVGNAGIDLREQMARVLAEHDLLQVVEFRPPVYGAERFRVLQQADILVLPSYSEGFPMVVLEAMCVGTPVIMTPVGALPEVFRDGQEVLFVKIGDVSNLASTLVRLIDDASLRSRLSEKARAIVRERFSDVQFSHRLGRAIDRVLGIDDRAVPLPLQEETS